MAARPLCGWHIQVLTTGLDTSDYAPEVERSRDLRAVRRPLAVAEYNHQEDPMTHDVIVVGAGFGGLRAARDLALADRSVLLLEGGHRVGGRAYTRSSRSFPAMQVEIGGAYLHRHHHPRLAAEIHRYGVPTQRVPEASVFRNRLGPGDHDKAFPVPIEEAAQAEAGLYRMLSDAHRIDVTAGLENQGLEDLDIPLLDYINSLRFSPVTRQLVLAWGWNMLGQHPSKSSALWALQFVASHGYSVLGVVLSIDEVISGGTNQLAVAMAADVPEVVLNARVFSVRQQEDGTYQVSAHRDGEAEAHRAHHVVIATPFNTWRMIEFDPPLPDARAEVIAQGHACKGLKLLIHVTGVPAGLSCVGDGVFPTLYDYLGTPDGGRLLVAFTDSESFDPTDANAIAAAVHHYVPEALVHGAEYHDWAADPLFRGPWVSPHIGQFTRVHKALGEPHGRVHFIGSDVSLRFPGYIEGALETAERAVEQIVQRTESCADDLYQA